jgi:hypothetical protein
MRPVPGPGRRPLRCAPRRGTDGAPSVWYSDRDRPATATGGLAPEDSIGARSVRGEPDLPLRTRKLTTFGAFPALALRRGGRAGSTAPAGLAARPRERDGCDLLNADQAGGHRHAHGDVRAFVPARRDRDLEGGRSTMGRDGGTEQDGDGSPGHPDHEPSPPSSDPDPARYTASGTTNGARYRRVSRRFASSEPSPTNRSFAGSTVSVRPS